MHTNRTPGTDGPVYWALRGASEGVTLALACLAPWAYGAVDAWAELGLEAAIVVLAVLSVAVRRGTRGSPLFCGPSLALAGLALLAGLQSVPLPGRVLDRVAPSNQALR